MAVDSAPSAGDYSSLFHSYVVRGAQQALAMAASQSANMGVDGREQALHTLAFVLDLPEAWPIARDLLVALAPHLERAGHRDDWIPYLEQGIARCQNEGDWGTEGELRWLLGTLRHLLGNLDVALREFEASAQCFARISDLRREARGLNRVANIHRLQRRFAQALQAADAAEVLLPPDDIEQGYNQLVRGGVAVERRAWEQAVQHYESALEVWQRAGDARLTAWGLTNLGTALRACGRIQEAIAGYQRAIAIMEEIEDQVNIGSPRVNLGNIYLNLQQYDLALELYTQAEQVFRQSRDLQRLAFVTTNLSMVHRHLGHLDKAVGYAEASIQLNQQVGDLANAINAMDILAEAYLAGARWTEAEAVLREAWALLEPIRDEPENLVLVQDVTQHLEEVMRRQDPAADGAARSR